MSRKEMIEERNVKAAELKKLTQKIEDEKRAFSEDEAQKFDVLETEIRTMDKDISRLERSASVVAKKVETAKPSLGMKDVDVSSSEARNYDLGGAMRSIIKGEKVGGLAGEVSADYAKRNGLDENSFHVPMSQLNRSAAKIMEQRTVEAGNAANGGNLIATELHEDKFIQLLRNRSALMGRVTVYDNLVGDVDIPRATSGVTVNEVGESDANTPSNPTFDTIALRPREVSSEVEITHKMLAQNNFNLERLTMDMMLADTAAKIDAMGLTDLLALSGTGNVEGGANGAVATLNHIIALESEIAESNADVSNMFYLMNARTKGKLKSTPIESGHPDRIMNIGNELNGYNTIVSNLVPSNLTKGSGTDLSAIIFGNFSDIILGTWGGMSFLANPYAKATERKTILHGHQMVDFGFRHPESFAIMKDVITA
ncbi:MAG: phage major capsid protein [Alphaproteobacteria bacterium]|nr:phage major capsid protein [Alphaproteobacteria bacterium]